MLSHTSPFIFLKKKKEPREYSKTFRSDGGGLVLVVFTIMQINYLAVSLFYDLLQPFSNLNFLY